MCCGHYCLQQTQFQSSPSVMPINFLLLSQLRTLPTTSWKQTWRRRCIYNASELLIVTPLFCLRVSVNFICHHWMWGISKRMNHECLGVIVQSRIYNKPLLPIAPTTGSLVQNHFLSNLFPSCVVGYLPMPEKYKNLI